MVPYGDAKENGKKTKKNIVSYGDAESRNGKILWKI